MDTTNQNVLLHKDAEATISAALEGREKFARLRTKLSRAHKKRGFK